MTTHLDNLLNILIQKIAQKAITHASDDFKIMSPEGQQQEWLIDLRPVLLDVEALNIISDLFWDRFENQLPFQIGGMEVAAVPLVTAILLKAQQRGLSTNGFIIRKERKKSGLGKLIEGDVTDDPIILVDDIFNSGKSIEKSRVALEQMGKKPHQVFTVLNYQNIHGTHWQKRYQTPVNYLLTLDPFDVSFNHTPYVPPKFNYEIFWRFYEPGAFPFHIVPKSTPLLVGDHIYMGTESGKMFCIDRHNGQVIWHFDVETTHPKGIWSSPAHHDGKIYFGAYNGNAYCLDANTGAQIWRNPCCEFIGSSPLLIPEKNMMFLGLEHQRPRQMGSNAAFNMQTSERIWEQAQKRYQHGSAAYYAPKELVIFGNADHNISAYDATTGKLIWKHETERSIKYPPTIDEKRKLVVATSFDGHIYVLDAETGKRKAAIKTNDICYTSALITNGKIFAGSGDRHMYVIDATIFTLIKKIDCYAKVYAPPKLIDGYVIFGTAGGRLIELNPETLKIDSHAQLPDAITNAVSSSPENDVLYVSTVMNELYAIKRIKNSTDSE
jgi:orotate phosphoribosyltransferase